MAAICSWHLGPPPEPRSTAKKQNPSRQARGGTRSAPAKAAKSPLGYLKGCEMPPTSVPIVPHEGLVGDPPCFCCSKLPRWHHFSAPRWQKHRSRGISLGSPSQGRKEAPGVAVLKGTGPMGLQLSCPPPSNSRICPHSSPALGRRPREPAPRGSQFKQETGKTQALPGARRVPSEPPASERRGKEAKFPAPWPEPPRGSGRQNPAAKKKVSFIIQPLFVFCAPLSSNKQNRLAGLICFLLNYTSSALM